MYVMYVYEYYNVMCECICVYQWTCTHTLCYAFCVSVYNVHVYSMLIESALYKYN